jgi:Ca2+-binding EF-hand superfamily protein
MQALAAELARRRLRLKDYFQDYDRLHAGFTTKDQFRRVLATAGVLASLTDAQVSEMEVTYTSGEKFCYAAFTRDLESLETTAVSSGTLQRVGQAPPKDTVLHSAFVLCAQQKAAAGVDVRQSFHPFDRHNNGKITPSQFQRSFPFKLDGAQLQAVVENYSSSGKADYFAFDSDLQAFIRSQAEGQNLMDWRESTVGASGTMNSPVRAARAKAQDTSTVETTLSELKYHLSKEQVNVAESFRDYDRLRSGVVSAGQFSSALGRVVLRGFKVSEAALANLVAHYRVEDAAGERVSYSRFLKDIDAAPMGGPRGGTVEDAEKQRVEAVLGKVRTVIRTRRVNLKPTFQDYDRANKGIYLTLTCTRKRFERALALNNVTLSTSEVDLLERAYSVNRTGEADTDAINYVAFCRDVDVPDGIVESPGVAKAAPTVGRGTFNATTGTTHVKKAPTLEAVLDTAMLQIASRSIRLHEFVRDYDTLRSGTVAKDKLATAMSMSGLRLEPDQVNLLLDTFAVAPGSDRVAYPRLMAALDCDAAGENDQTIHRVDEARARVTAEAQAATEAVHSEQLDNIIQRIREDVRARQILLPPFFQDYDKHHRGCITAAQFERVLTRHRLPVSPSDMVVLKQFFADPTDANNVRCRDFIATVDDAEASRAPKHLRPAAATSSPSSPLRGVTRASVAADVNDTMGRINRTVLARGIRISELFRDADPLRKGVCHEGKFAGALSSLGIQLSSAEIDALRNHYDDPKDKTSVCYSRFCNDVNSVEFQRNIGAGELTMSKGLSMRAAPPQGDFSTVEARVAEDAILGKLFADVQTATRARRMSVRSALQDFDKLRKGRIPSSQFFSALSANGVTFNALQTSKLLELLGENGVVNYGFFCRLIGE